MILNQDDVNHLPKSDVELRALHWPDEKSLAITLRHFADGQSKELNLVFLWCSALSINLVFGENSGGYPLTWDTKFNREADRTWLVLLDFGSIGELRLRCNDIELVAT